MKQNITMKQNIRHKILRGSIFKGTIIHNCVLPPPEDVVVKYIDSGCFVDLRRKFRRLFTVNENSPNSKIYLRSSATIKHEKKLHLQHHYYMIHPFSDGRNYWEFFMIFVFFFILILIPIDNAMRTTLLYISVPKICLDFICCVDIGVTFCCGYHEKQTRKTVLDPRKVAIKYITGYFFIDLISSLPLDLIIGPFLSHNSIVFMKMFSYLKLMRLTTLIKYLERFRIRKNFSIHRFKIFKLLLVFSIALLWATCFRYLIFVIFYEHDIKEQTTTQQLLRSCMLSLNNLFLMGYVMDVDENYASIVFTILCLNIGLLLHMYIYAQVYQFFNRHFNTSNQYQFVLHQIHEFMNYKQLPETLRKRILMFVEYRFQKCYYKESEILETLSDNLQQDVILHLCQSLVEKVDFFRNLPPALLLKISQCMKTEIYLTNDVVVRVGQSGDAMFFIVSGTVAVYASNGKEVCHITDGGHFGEIALVMENEKRVASVVAVECCEVYILSRRDFKKAVAPFPEINEQMRHLAQQRLRSTIRIMST